MHNAQQQNHTAEHDLMKAPQRGGIAITQTVQNTVFKKYSPGRFIHNQFLLPWFFFLHMLKQIKNGHQVHMPAESLIPLLLCNTKIVFLRARLSALLCQIVGESKVGKKPLLLSLAFTVSHTDMTLQSHICQHPLSAFTVNNTFFHWQAISPHWKCHECNSV